MLTAQDVIDRLRYAHSKGDNGSECMDMMYAEFEKIEEELANPSTAPVLTAELLAEAFDCFNNEAIGLMHGGTHEIGCIAAGMSAIAHRLRQG